MRRLRRSCHALSAVPSNMQRWSQVVGYDKAGRFKACDDAIAAVGRARDVLKKTDVKARGQGCILTGSCHMSKSRAVYQQIPAGRCAEGRRDSLPEGGRNEVEIP